MATLIFAVCFSLGISFLCSVLESCFLSMSLTDIAEISDQNPRLSKIWIEFKRNIQQPIAVILIINTIAHTVGATVSGAAFDEIFGPKWIIVFSLIYSIVMIQWTEILPKTLGVKHKKKISIIAAVPIKILIICFIPVLKIIEFLNKPFELKEKRVIKNNALHEILTLVRFAKNEKLISKEQKDIFQRTAAITKIFAEDIMIPLKNMKYLDDKMSIDEALKISKYHHHTRMPLIKKNDWNNIVSYINIKDILYNPDIRTNSCCELERIERPLLKINKKESVSSSLNFLIKNSQHIAIIMDENKPVGLLTLEDVMENIVGDIDDEFDKIPDYCYKISDKKIIAGGGCKISTIEKQMKIILNNSNEKDLNVNDWLYSRNKNIVQSKNSFLYNNINFSIHKKNRFKVNEVLIELIEN